MSDKLKECPLDALRAELAELKQKLIRQSEVCFWTPDAGYDYIAYDSQCGKSWVLEDGGPKENDMQYCPFCGKLLVQVESDQSEEE